LPDLSQRLTAALADRYRIERELGRGGMATVFLAQDLKHDRRVAIKVLDPEVAAAIGPERFLREIATVARLTHPHILPLHDSGAVDGLLFYVMPYVEGESLRDRLIREKQLPVDDALRIAREVADALSYAHANGLVHRDVKPENVLLESGHAVVADFGIARAVAAAGGEKLTATGIAVGTPAYMSPEQAAGSRDLDGRSDLYSLGCVLYEMLAGVPPFSGTTVESLTHQHLNVTPRPVTELRPAVPAGVAAALQRALAKTPADRFSPVALFGEALGSAATVPGALVPQPKPRWRPVVMSLAVVVIVAVAASATLWVTRGRRETPPALALEPVHTRTEIAVLPFQNLTAGGPHAYFAGGLHDELLTQLAKVAALKTISRTSVMGYAGTTKPLKQIAAELGVGSIVEGTVQVEGQRLRVTVQLIDAATDEHLWAERYDRTLDDAFAIQSDVAQRIVVAVGATLTAREGERISAIPTSNAEAYRLYLQASALEIPQESADVAPAAVARANLAQQQDLLERALALDPKFALAHAYLSSVHGTMYWYGFDPSSARAARQRAEAETALRLSPDLPQAHLAMGLAEYWGRLEYSKALVEFDLALRGMPGDASPWVWIGYANRRLGNWSRVYDAYEQAARLDPRQPGIFYNLGGITFWGTRRYADAIEAYERAARIDGGIRPAMSWRKGWVYVVWRGQLDTLRAALDDLPAEYESRADLLLLERQPDRLLALLASVPERVFPSRCPKSLYEAWAHRLAGNERSARTAFESSVVLLDSISTGLRGGGVMTAWQVHARRGLALAGCGRRVAAMQEAQWLKQSDVYRRDAFEGLEVAESRALILAQVGDVDAALNEIERLLAGPSMLSVHTLRLNPRWDPIREHPRFKALLVKYADPEKWAVR